MKNSLFEEVKFNYKVLIAALVLVIIVLFFAPIKALDPAKNVLNIIVKPFTIAANYTVDRTSFFFRNLAHLRSLSSENQKLIKENLELQGQLSILKEVQHENEILKNEMGFLSRKGDLNLIPANIIGRSSSGYLKTIVIDRGSSDDVIEGQAIVSQGFLVGTITSVFGDSSEVTLITNNNSLVPVILQDSRGTGLLRGGISGLAVEDIPLNIPISKGEQVVTSGLGGEIPPGIMVGEVEDVVSLTGEIFQKVSIKSPIEIYFLEFVFVVQ